MPPPRPLRFLLVLTAAALATAGWMVYLRGIPVQPAWADWSATASGPAGAAKGLTFSAPHVERVEIAGVATNAAGRVELALRAHRPSLRAVMPFPFSPRFRVRLKGSPLRVFEAVDAGLRAINPDLRLLELRFHESKPGDPDAALLVDPPVHAADQP